MEKLAELHREPEAAAEMAANAVLKYLSECGIVEQDAKQKWIAKVFEAVKTRAK